MPHIVIEGPAAIDRYVQEFSPTVESNAGVILKTTGVFYNSAKRSALVESIVVENGRSQNFFIHAAENKGSLTVRLLPQTDPEKTDGVKRLMALVAADIKKQDDGCSYGKTNLDQYLV